jgi:geranylgeranylglycerol-phosphate geranylgeranyltransferase
MSNNNNITYSEKISLNLFLKGLFSICRPFNSTLAGLATIIGILISVGFQDVSSYFNEMILAALVTSLIAAGGYVINDYFDVEIDRINQPKRPIPANQVTVKQAYYFSNLLFISGFILSLVLASIEEVDIITKLLTPILAFLGIFCLYSYAFYFKRTAGIGNLIITILVCIPLVYGGIITGEFKQTVYPILVASTLMLGREIIKDIEDVKGDKEGSTKQITTLPMIIGVRKTALLGKSILILFLICSPIAFLTNDIIIFQSWGLLICIIVADVLVFSSIMNLKGNELELIKNTTKSKRLLKSAIAIGVVGLLLASITPFSQLPKLF